MSRQAHSIKAPVPPKEGASRIRTKSVRLKKPNGSEGAETPEIFLWAGSESLFISADLRGADPEDLQIRVSGTRLIFHGTLRPGLNPEKGGIHLTKEAPSTFSHALDLPYEVHADGAEVLNENGLISIVLKRKEARQPGARVTQSSFETSMQRFFGENGVSSRTLKDEITILETLERYLEYHFGKGFAR